MNWRKLGGAAIEAMARKYRAPLLSMLIVSELLAAKPADWTSGKVVDANTARAYIQTSTDKPLTVRESQIAIVGAEYAYVVSDTTMKASLNPIGGGLGRAVISRSVSNHSKGCRYIVGESIGYWQDKGSLHVRDVDGKECKVEILRQERLK